MAFAHGRAYYGAPCQAEVEEREGQDGYRARYAEVFLDLLSAWGNNGGCESPTTGTRVSRCLHSKR